ncbi:MAG: DUF1698 domain-containing protein [Pseudomonadota bacterium]
MNPATLAYNRTNDECDAFLEKRLPHYHVIRLNDEVRTPGRVDRNHEFGYVGLTNADLLEKSVLDVGALDGVISFNCERGGARRVLAIDVEDPAEQDWGYSGPAASFANHGDVKNRVFPELKTFFNSNVERQRKTVYQVDPKVDGEFDLVFFYGVLYHLRHPLLSFDRLRAVSRAAICVETHVCNFDPMLPASLFYLDDVLAKAESNWTGPTESCVASWMRDAGYRTIYAERKPRVASRQRFIGFCDAPTFEVNETNFRLLDDAYFAEARREALSKLRIGQFWRA